MLLFNKIRSLRDSSLGLISKHLMLLFNQAYIHLLLYFFQFQNISCYCLSYVAAGSCWSNCISKHLMLLFNCISTFFRTIFCTISKHLMLLFNKTRNSYGKKESGFQNISCYCLTLLLVLHNTLHCLFQNISCYCLTNDFTSFFNGLFKKTTILCTFPLFFPSAPSIYCFSKKVHISAISNTFSGNHLVKFCTFKYQ